MARALILVVLIALGTIGFDEATALAAPRNPPTIAATLIARAASGDGELAVGSVVALAQVTDIAFATVRTGYALGGPLGYGYPEKTTDGGRTWRIAGPAFFLPTADAPDAVGEIVAVGAEEAYAYGGTGSTIDITTDGGTQWWRASLGQALIAVAQHGRDIWALALGPTPTATSVPSVWLYDSSDGGRIWQYRSTLSGVLGWEADLTRPDATTAFALVKSFRAAAPSGAGIVETTDGGATWTKRVDPCSVRIGDDAVNWTERLEASSATSLWLFCGSQPSTGMQTKLIERSDDGGRSWTVVASTALDGHVGAHNISPIGQLPDSGTTGYLTVTSSSDALLTLIGNNVLWRTTDGGRTWMPGAAPSIEAQFPQSFSLASGALFVKTQNALWVSQRYNSWALLAGTAKRY